MSEKGKSLFGLIPPANNTNSQLSLSLEIRMKEMRMHFQQSYDLFMRAHDDLSKLTFQRLSFDIEEDKQAESPFNFLGKKDVDEILNSVSINDTINVLRSKVNFDDVRSKKTPELCEFMSIISDLQSGIKSLVIKQEQLTDITEDVNEEINQIRSRTQETVLKIEDLIGEELESSEDEKTAEE